MTIDLGNLVRTNFRSPEAQHVARGILNDVNLLSLRLRIFLETFRRSTASKRIGLLNNVPSTFDFLPAPFTSRVNLENPAEIIDSLYVMRVLKARPVAELRDTVLLESTFNFIKQVFDANDHAVVLVIWENKNPHIWHKLCEKLNGLADPVMDASVYDVRTGVRMAASGNIELGGKRVWLVDASVADCGVNFPYENLHLYVNIPFENMPNSRFTQLVWRMRNAKPTSKIFLNGITFDWSDFKSRLLKNIQLDQEVFLKLQRDLYHVDVPTHVKFAADSHIENIRKFFGVA